MDDHTSNLGQAKELERVMRPYHCACFVKSAANVGQMPVDQGHEVAIVGRSNAGKSTFLNTLTGQKNLARTSKTPGRTRLMNVFGLDVADKRIVDLPGYGFAKVAKKLRFDWEAHLSEYFSLRQSLSGVVVLMDIRHPLQELDLAMIAQLVRQQLPLYILLTKSDKVSKSKAISTRNQVSVQLSHIGLSHCVQTFSIQDPGSLLQVIRILNGWLDLSE